VLGTDEAIERFNREHPDLSQPSRNEPPQPEKPQESGHPTRADRLEAIEQAIEGFFEHRVGATHQAIDYMIIGLVGFTHPTKVKQRCDYAAALALAATVAGEFYFRSSHETSRVRSRFSAPQGRWSMRGKTENPARVRRRD
jgi:hypothetical protein